MVASPQTRHSRWIGGALVLACAGGWSVARAAGLTDEQLAAGEIETTLIDRPGLALPETRFRGVVEASPARVWRVIDDCARFEKIMVEALVAKEESRQGTEIRCRIDLDVPWPMDNLTSITKARHEVSGERYSKAWVLESGNYQRNDGAWVLTPFKGDPNRTLVEYWSIVIPNTSAPDFILKQVQRDVLPQLLRNLRTVVAELPADVKTP